MRNKILQTLYGQMDAAFALGKNADGGLPIDDTQLGVEFAFNVLIHDMEAAIDTIGYLLPLAKGYVAAHPAIRSTEAIIEDAEAMIRAFSA